MRSYLIFWDSQVMLVVKNPPASAGDVKDTGSILSSGRSPGGGHGNSLQYSCPENPMDRGALWAIVYRIPQGRTRLSSCMCTHTHIYMRLRIVNRPPTRDQAHAPLQLKRGILTIGVPEKSQLKGFFFVCLFFIFGCTGSFFAELGIFLQLQQVGTTLQLRCSGFSLQRLHLSQSTGSRACRLQQLWLLGSRSQASVVVARGLRCLSECGIFLEQGSTHVPCIARWILNHWATREAQGWALSSCRNTDLEPGDPELLLSG